MRRYFDIGIPLCLFVNLMWLTIVCFVNSELVPYVYLMLPAVFIVPPVLSLGFLGSLFVVGITALLFEAATPARPLSLCALWILSAFIIRGMCFRLKNAGPFTIFCFMEIFNLLIIGIFALCMPSDISDFSEYVVRVGVDTLASSFAIALVGVFSVKLQTSIAKTLEGEIPAVSEDR